MSAAGLNFGCPMALSNDLMRDPVFDLEDTRSRLISDARQWVEVYRELLQGIDYISSGVPDIGAGLIRRRAEYRRRLEFWQQRARELAAAAG